MYSEIEMLGLGFMISFAHIYWILNFIHLFLADKSCSITSDSILFDECQPCFRFDVPAVTW